MAVSQSGKVLLHLWARLLLLAVSRSGSALAPLCGAITGRALALAAWAGAVLRLAQDMSQLEAGLAELKEARVEAPGGVGLQQRALCAQLLERNLHCQLVGQSASPRLLSQWSVGHSVSHWRTNGRRSERSSSVRLAQ